MNQKILLIVPLVVLVLLVSGCIEKPAVQENKSLSETPQNQTCYEPAEEGGSKYCICGNPKHNETGRCILTKEENKKCVSDSECVFSGGSCCYGCYSVNSLPVYEQFGVCDDIPPMKCECIKDICQESVIGCPEEIATFEYQGCSVNYTKILLSEGCRPCGGILPCVGGFDHNKKLDILNCLCDSGKISEAQNFTREKFDYLDLNETRISGICENKPEPVQYE